MIHSRGPSASATTVPAAHRAVTTDTQQTPRPLVGFPTAPTSMDIAELDVPSSVKPLTNPAQTHASPATSSQPHPTESHVHLAESLKRSLDAYRINRQSRLSAYRQALARSPWTVFTRWTQSPHCEVITFAECHQDNQHIVAFLLWVAL